jgi:hypothetical protein
VYLDVKSATAQSSLEWLSITGRLGQPFLIFCFLSVRPPCYAGHTCGKHCILLRGWRVGQPFLIFCFLSVRPPCYAGHTCGKHCILLRGCPTLFPFSEKGWAILLFNFPFLHFRPRCSLPVRARRLASGFLRSLCEHPWPIESNQKPSPPLVLHRRVLRFSLTRTFLGDKLAPRFRRFRRDSRSLVRAQFLYKPSSASSSKRAVPPRFLFLHSRGA